MRGAILAEVGFDGGAGGDERGGAGERTPRGDTEATGAFVEGAAGATWGGCTAGGGVGETSEFAIGVGVAIGVVVAVGVGVAVVAAGVEVAARVEVSIGAEVAKTPLERCSGDR